LDQGREVCAKRHFSDHFCLRVFYVFWYLILWSVGWTKCPSADCCNRANTNKWNKQPSFCWLYEAISMRTRSICERMMGLVLVAVWWDSLFLIVVPGKLLVVDLQWVTGGVKLRTPII
jgi:hypothetical protein